MKAYNEIFLSAELNKALQDILVNIHRHFHAFPNSLYGKAQEKALRKIYKPILNCPILKNNIVWFNAWSEKHTGRIELYFIKDCDEIAKKIIGIYQTDYENYAQYVNSLSVLARSYKVGEIKTPLDYAYLITPGEYQECDIEMASEYIYDFFIYLKFNYVTQLFERYNFLEIRKNMNNDVEIIGILRDNYKNLKENNSLDKVVKDLADQLGSVWNIDLNASISQQPVFDSNGQSLTEKSPRENIIKLMNYYFWVKLAYPEEWKVLLYLPGIIAKEFKGIPLGVNIGLKEMVPLDVLLFLKKAVLLFFTRESVGFFEGKAKKEAAENLQLLQKLYKQEREFSHLLYEFPHIIGNYVSLDIEKALEFNDNETPKRWAKFMKRMGTYMSSTLTSKDISQTLIQYNFKETIRNFYEMPLRLTVDKAKALNSRDDYTAEVNNWKEMFNIDSINKISDSLDINLPEGVLEIIFSNLLSNTKKANNGNSMRKVIITVEKKNDKYIITYQEGNGKGFDGSTIKKLSRWTREGPLEEEKTKGFGYRSMYKAAVEISNGQMEIIVKYNGEEINILDNHNSISIPDEEIFHPIHKFIFTSQPLKKLKKKVAN